MIKGDLFEHRFTVDEQLYQNFIGCFGDRNPLHTDPEFARSKGFRDKVMHGNILNGFLSYFIGECLPIKNVIIHTEEIKYALPVYLGDELFFQATVSEVYESVNTVELKFFFKREQDKKVATGKIQIGII